MTLHEKRRFAEQFMKRRTSRIVSAQSGYQDQLVNFADPYEHDTLEQANADTEGAPTNTTRTDTVGDNNWKGTVPGGSNDDSPIYGALDILQKHIEGLGSSDLLDLWASTSDALKKTVGPDFVKAKPNADGVTREPLRVADNTNSQTPGSHGYISANELSRMESEASHLTKMTSRVVSVTAL